MSVDFTALTELPGLGISEEQLGRMVTRYGWAGEYCQDKDVVEVGCGGGQGLQMLSRKARSLVAGDYSDAVLERARKVNPGIELKAFDAQALPFADESRDVILLFEALYYVPDPMKFFREAARVLRPGGYLLLATANKDLFDFSPSPHSYSYLGVAELQSALNGLGFDCKFFGDVRVDEVSLRQRVLRPVKYLVVHFGLMPKSLQGKEWLKRLVFGRTLPMPASLDEGMIYTPPTPIDGGAPDRVHKVVLCAARKPG